MLDLEFTPEQDMLRDTVRKLCASDSPLSVVRELEDDPVGFSTELWKDMAGLDLIGLLLPEDHGGSGMGACSVTASRAIDALSAPLLTSSRARSSAAPSPWASAKTLTR